MKPSAGIGPEAKAEAAAWLARLHADDRSDADENAFRTWLAAKPENARAFEAVTNLWDLADGLRMVPVASARSRLRIRRRTVIASLGSLAAAAGGLAFWEEAYAGVYQTTVGEQKRVTLSDGTQCFLDTDTRIRERSSASLRTVELDRGRADFRVKQDNRRPFVVEAANQRIVAEQSTLDVRRDGGRISVVLLEGRATVATAARALAQPVVLTRGERAVVAENMPIRVDRPNLSPLIAWQTGQAMFENDTLAAAAAEMNRYSTIPLTVDDPVIARLKLSGVYRVGDNDAFAHSVALLLPVTLERYPDHIAIVRDESRMPEG